MAIASIVTYGFGSYGSVNKVPTHGFGIGELPTGKVTVGFAAKSPSVGFTAKSPSVGFEVS